MKKRRDLPEEQLYESVYAPVQTYKQSELFKVKFVKREEKELKKNLNGYQGRFTGYLKWIWANAFGHFAEEWVFLAVLGILVALISYMIDRGVQMCNQCRVYLYRDLATHPWAKYFGWISLPVTLVMWSAGIGKLLAPKVPGSGLPQIKTILRGVMIDDFVTFRALIAKVAGITATLGSSMPLGKEGPLIHISCCLVNLLGKLTTFQGIYQNESRKVEMFAAAAAVGVGCTFGAPIGGVLFSVELTTAYYNVRNYWRGFCAAIWGATFYRLLSVWIEGVESVAPVFKTNFFVENAFAAQELFAFSILGIICGFAAAFFIRMKIKFGQFLKNSSSIAKIKKANFFIYPGFISLVVVSISFPLGIGQFMSSQVPYGAQVKHMFANFSWTAENLTVEQRAIVQNWETKWTGLYLHLICLIAFNFVCSMLASTMPIPGGNFIPTFRIGAAIGRIMGELMYAWHPQGLSYWGRVTPIIPGGYSLVGAAAFTGGCTQTMSVAIFALEMSGQITHVYPILIAVLISNSICQLLGPCMYNIAIKGKNLPYLPDLLPQNSAIYSVYVEDFMLTDVKYIHHGMTFAKLKELLVENKKLSSFPLVNNPVRMILLGSIKRSTLINLIESQVGKRRRMEMIITDQGQLKQIADERAAELNFTENPVYDHPPEGEKKDLAPKRVCDLLPKLQKQWEREQMQETINFNLCKIDPAPFQLVERTSLLKVHSLFSLVGLNKAYVTSIGKLVGVVGLEELRKAIKDVKSGVLQPHNIQIVVSDEEQQERHEK